MVQIINEAQFYYLSITDRAEKYHDVDETTLKTVHLQTHTLMLSHETSPTFLSSKTKRWLLEVFSTIGAAK